MTAGFVLSAGVTVRNGRIELYNQLPLGLLARPRPSPNVITTCRFSMHPAPAPRSEGAGNPWEIIVRNGEVRRENSALIFPS